jgi:uncharacterized protein with GYD domain
MMTFLMFGKYSPESLREVSAERTDSAVDLIQRSGGQVRSMYALLGERDLVLVVDFPSVEDAMKTSIALGRLTGIAFFTNAAVSVDRFDELIEDL